MAKAAVVQPGVPAGEANLFPFVGDELSDLGRSITRLCQAPSDPPERELVVPLTDRQIEQHLRPRR